MNASLSRFHPLTRGIALARLICLIRIGYIRVLVFVKKCIPVFYEILVSLQKNSVCIRGRVYVVMWVNCKLSVFVYLKPLKKKEKCKHMLKKVPTPTQNRQQLQDVAATPLAQLHPGKRNRSWRAIRFWKFRMPKLVWYSRTWIHLFYSFALNCLKKFT